MARSALLGLVFLRFDLDRALMFCRFFSVFFCSSSLRLDLIMSSASMRFVDGWMDAFVHSQIGGGIERREV